MKPLKSVSLGITILSILLSGCSGGKKVEEGPRAAQFLPEKVLGTEIVRAKDIHTYTGDSLWQYIDGGAEIYLLYNFVEVATVEYKSGRSELIADIYHFETPDDAYGLYTTLRPEKQTIVHLGIEGFSVPSGITFVKGPFLTRIMGYEDTDSTNRAVIDLAGEINKSIIGASNRPTTFLLFPINNVIGLHNKYYSKGFMDQKYLTHVYTQDYLLDGDTVTLFLSRDQSGEKFLQWSEFTSTAPKIENPTDSLSYDSSKSFIYNDNLYGLTRAGLRKGKLLGMIKYSDAHMSFLADWMNSFQ